MKTIIVAGLGLLALAVIPLTETRNTLAASGPTSAASTAPATEPGSAADLTTVRRGNIQLDIHADGYLEAIDPLEVRIDPKAYAGELKIDSISDNGAHVKKGDTILRIDHSEFDRQLAAARNDALLAHATLDKAQSDVTLGDQSDALALATQKNHQAEAQEGVAWWEKVNGPVELAISNYIARQWDYQLTDAQDELKELKKMYKSEELTNATTDIVMKRAQQEIDLATIADTIENEQKDEFARFHYDFLHRDVTAEATAADQATAQLQAQQTQSKVIRHTTLVSAQAGADAADKKVADLVADGALLSVVAPSDGVVLYGQLVGGNWQNDDEQALRVGQNVTPRQVLLTFFVPGKVRGTVDLTESQFFAIPPSAKATLTPSAFPGLFLAGTCQASVPQGHATQTGVEYPLHISLANADDRLIPGMHVSISIKADLAKNVLIIPLTAVADGAVHLTQGRSSPLDLAFGASDGTNIEVRSGLTEGEEVQTHAKK